MTRKQVLEKEVRGSSPLLYPTALSNFASSPPPPSQATFLFLNNFISFLPHCIALTLNYGAGRIKIGDT